MNRMRVYEKLKTEMMNNKSLSIEYENFKKNKLFLIDYDNFCKTINNIADDYSNVYSCEEIKNVNWNPKQQVIPFKNMFFEFTNPITLTDYDDKGNEYIKNSFPSINKIYAIEVWVDKLYDDYFKKTGKQPTVDLMLLSANIWINDSTKNIQNTSNKATQSDWLGFKMMMTSIWMFTFGIPCPDRGSCLFCSKNPLTQQQLNQKLTKNPNQIWIHNGFDFNGDIKTLKQGCCVNALPFVSMNKNYKCSRLLYYAKARRLLYQILAYINSAQTIKTFVEYEPGFVTMQSGEKKRKPLPDPYYELRLSRDTESDKKIIQKKSGWSVSYAFDVRSHIRRYRERNKTSVVKSHKRGIKYLNNAYIPKTYVLDSAKPNKVQPTRNFMQKGISFATNIYNHIKGLIK